MVRRYCCVESCSSKEGSRTTLGFFVIPKVNVRSKVNSVAAITTQQRRNKWLERIDPSNRLDLSRINFVCSKHFVSGSPVDECEDVDWVPSLMLNGVIQESNTSVECNPINNSECNLTDVIEARHSSTRPTVPSSTSQKSKTTPKISCSAISLPKAKDPLLLPIGRSDLPNPTKSPESSINFTGSSHSIPLPVDGPITHYIIVQDKISIPNKPTLTVEDGLNLNATLSNVVTPTVQNDRMDVSSSASCSLDHSYVLVPQRSLTSLEESAAASSTSHNCESATLQEALENASPNESDHNYVIRSSSAPIVIEEESLHLDMAGYHNFINGVATPTAEWAWSFNEQNNNLVCSCHIFSYDGVMTIKSVKIITMTKVALYLNGKPITPPDIQFEFRTKAHLANILKDFNYRKVCQGIVDDSLADTEVTGKCTGNKEGNLWRSKMCTGVVDRSSTVLCSKCRTFEKYLKKITNNQKTKKLKNSKEDYKLKLRSTEKRLKRAKSKIEALSGTIESLREERKKLYWNSFDVKIKLLKPKEQLVVKTMMEKAKVNPGRNDRFSAMRYDPEFLKECLRIKKKSSSAYKHLRSEGILPLPSQATLLRILKKKDLDDSNKSTQSAPLNGSAESNFMEQSNVENKSHALPHFNESVLPTPEMILPHSEEIQIPLSVQEEMIVEISSV